MSINSRTIAKYYSPCGNPDNFFANCQVELRYHEMMGTLMSVALFAFIITCLLSLLSLSCSACSGCLDFSCSSEKGKSKCDQKKSADATAKTCKTTRDKTKDTSKDAPSTLRVSA
ncbi:hypothetical protein M3Y94_01304200 [Aphelenchoides besseyi]|nr:hypothetical protein M3Y94_01304200 [Aphelenchoides besseyi]KAI6220209.1 hypothetical protein M3Y95_01060600 [Aphelenchoides besseyi]